MKTIGLEVKSKGSGKPAGKPPKGAGGKVAGAGKAE